MRTKDNRGFIFIPEWMQLFIVAAIIVGVLTIIAGSIAAIVWVINHVRFI